MSPLYKRKGRRQKKCVVVFPWRRQQHRKLSFLLIFYSTSFVAQLANRRLVLGGTNREERCWPTLMMAHVGHDEHQTSGVKHGAPVTSV